MGKGLGTFFLLLGIAIFLYGLLGSPNESLLVAGNNTIKIVGIAVSFVGLLLLAVSGPKYPFRQ